MKKHSKLLHIILLAGFLTACSSGAQPSVQQAGGTEPSVAGTEAGQPTIIQPETASSIQHTSVPAEPPATGGKKWRDYSSTSESSPKRALIGDQFTEGKFERPYNANTMDVYFPDLDIDHVVLYSEDATWVYVAISMVGRDANNAFAGQYAVELDLDQYGHGDFLILVNDPASTDWTTKGVQVLQDKNGDVGGQKAVVADSIGATGDGYETVLFDQGTGDDPDLAWVRLDPADVNSIQIAFKQTLLAGEKTYTAGAWAATKLEPALFDYNDHMSHEQAGAAYSEITNFYPIKGLAELDNTCREAIGFVQSGKEPGICPP